MTALLIVVLTVLLLAAGLALLIMVLLLAGATKDRQGQELTRLVHETRQAEGELHTLTTNALQAMLDELRWQK